VSAKESLPTNLIEAIRHFSDINVCTEFVAELRWPNGPVCPRCGCVEYSYLTTRRLWKCKGCKKQFSVKLGTIFEDSALGLDKWLPAVWLIANSTNGISSHELGRAVGTTQKSAWFMLHRIRLAMQTGTFEKLDGAVEVDETFIGGKARNMHKDVRKRKITGTGGKDKTIVVGVRQRGGEMRAAVVPDRKRTTLHGHVTAQVEPGATVYTMPLRPTPGSAETSPTTPSITPSGTSRGRSIPTAPRTSGACSSVACTAPTSASSPSTFSGIWTSGCSPTTCAR
jgi:transposase-like protein